MSRVEAVILAGGFGSRMGGICRENQKCILPIEEKPIIIHIVENLTRAFGDIDLKVAVGHKAEQVVDTINSIKTTGMNVTYVRHRPGTEGWGIYLDLETQMSGAFIATPGDIICTPENYQKVYELFDSNKVDFSMAMSSDLEKAPTHGTGKINGIEVVDLQWPAPSESNDSGQLRDMTIWTSDKKIFSLLRRFPSPQKSIGHFFTKALKAGASVAGHIYSDHWVHVGSRYDLEKA